MQAVVDDLLEVLSDLDASRPVARSVIACNINFRLRLVTRAAARNLSLTVMFGRAVLDLRDNQQLVDVAVGQLKVGFFVFGEF